MGEGEIFTAYKKNSCKKLHKSRDKYINQAQESVKTSERNTNFNSFYTS